MDDFRYDRLKGKNKTDIILEMGHGFNYFHNDKWTYHLKKEWLGQRTVLVICFEKDIATNVSVKRTFFKKL